MRVCTATGADPEGNSCTWTNCALGASEFGSFGGCASNPTAGTLCVKDCADGTTEQTFANGMVGCAGKDTWDNRNAECGVGHLVANAAQWSSFRGVETVGDPPLVQPTTTTHDYWTDTNLEFTGSSTSCSATPINGLSCPVNQPMRVCTSSGTDGEGNACNWTNCGYGSSVVSAALGGCGGNTTAGAVCLPDSDVYCDASGCISAQKFAASVDAQLQNKVVGYTAVVGTHVAEYGQARTSADPPATPMANNVPFHMASISKVLTTVAALQILTFHGLSVDAFIAPYLPSDWVKGPGVVSTPTVPGITFRQLLTHSAGLLNDAMTYTEIQQQIQLGIVQASKSTPTYRNINFALFRILLPLIQATGPNPSFVDPGPAGRDITTQNYYATYMNQHVFQPLGIFDATLNGTTSPPFALYYPFPAGSATGQAPGNWTALAGGGGWNLSTAEIYRVLSSLGSDNVLLSDGQKTQMNDGCLGWDCSVMSQPGYRGKNGLLIPSGAIPGSRYEVNTFMGIFKGRLGVVILTNSDPGQNLYSVVQTAVAAAAVAHP
jgi:CubicO group peptidase (beta-lactamase class C family)